MNRAHIGCVLVAVVLGCRRADRGASPIADVAAPQLPALPERTFDCTLVDTSKLSGIQFRHVTGGCGEKLFPEAWGSGCAFLDFDGDGALDLFFANGTYWPACKPETGKSPTCALYKGRGDGTFEDVTAASGAAASLHGMGASVADYDGDGDDDLFVTGVDRNVLLRNDSGAFVDVTASAGLTVRTWKDRHGRENPEWATASAWADFDGDGDVDLFVGQFVQWSPEAEIYTTLDGVTKAFATADRYRGLPCRLFLNRGDGSFEDATESCGLRAAVGKTLGVAIWDFDFNGCPDLVVANHTQPNFLFMNFGGAFLECGLAAKIAYDETGRARAATGIDAADYMNAGIAGIAIGSFADEPVSLYRGQANGTFDDVAIRAGLALPTYPNAAFGVLFLDIDLDGVLDLVVANGHIEPEVARVLPSQSYRQSPQLFQGRAFGRFEDVSARAGPDFLVPRAARGLAAGDIDGDGDLDLVLTTSGGPPVVFTNVRGPNSQHHYLRVRLRGKGKNTRALGTVIRLTAGGVTQTRVSRTGGSYLSQSESTITFGLGSTTTIDALEVTWPSRRTVRVEVPGADRTIEIREE